MAGRTSPAGAHWHSGSPTKFARIKGGSAGNLTVTGVEAKDPLLAVIGLGKMSGVYFINTVADFTSEFSTGAALINNTSGTDTSNWMLLVAWDDLNG